MKWGVLGYANGACYIVALKDRVNIGFSLKEIPKEKQKLLDCTGKETGHIEIKDLGSIDELKIFTLLKLAMKNDSAETHHVPCFLCSSGRRSESRRLLELLVSRPKEREPDVACR
ncbi:MAG: hypothetical protein WC488_01840 [Candidatus Micrarchaeia archaeon]